MDTRIIENRTASKVRKTIWLKNPAIIVVVVIATNDNLNPETPVLS